ncbi:hypothetical protein HD806DRAFT_247144 [Xylariaceae sp. AK1471]|nr:hypothetical protein HD806DRAFT_247144 [Xylariaceae sp. AK1471]
MLHRKSFLGVPLVPRQLIHDHRDGGPARIFLIPGSAAVNIGNNDEKNTVFVLVKTNTYTISVASPFTLYMRNFTWADSKNIINGNTKVTPDEYVLQKVTVRASKSTTSLQLSTIPRIVPRANGTAAIYYGAFL